MVALSVERCKTGIPGFDELCEGGFVSESINAVLGGPGAGKTTFLLQFLWNGVNEFGENGLYISFEPEVESIHEDARTYGWDFTKLDANGKCRFIRMSPNTNISDLKTELTKLVSKYDVRRVCFDPISVLTMTFEKDSDIREIIFDLASLLKRMKVTVLIADETVDGTMDNFTLGSGNTRTDFVKFLVDGLVNLYSAGLGGESDRAIRITKMRRTNHVRGPVAFRITDKGVVVSKGK
jgi:circadian clock protein KaiC